MAIAILTPFDLMAVILKIMTNAFVTQSISTLSKYVSCKISCLYHKMIYFDNNEVFRPTRATSLFVLIQQCMLFKTKNDA